jgi:hypothetical protein
MTSGPDRFAWIRAEAPPEQADQLRAIYRRLGAPESGHGFDHVLKIHAPMPPTIEQHLAFYRGIMRDPGPLPRAEREIIGVVISARNECHY